MFSTFDKINDIQTCTVYDILIQLSRLKSLYCQSKWHYYQHQVKYYNINNASYRPLNKIYRKPKT